MKPQLTVYKASAGSGKTFTLAREYMTLVIDNPMSYRTILAVTFTNKATEEMKMRILSQLYGIAHQLPTSKSYLKPIQEALPHLSEKQIIENAGTALSLLIHNYNYFRVETIDTFFQSVLRNLARELDLTANLRIELNDRQIEQHAVDELIEDLQATDKLLFRILAYIKESIADDKSWNIIGQIKSFGENIFKDYYKDHAEQLTQLLEKEGFIDNYKKKILKLRDSSKEKITEVATSFFDTLDAYGFNADDLAGKSRGIGSYFKKLLNGNYDEKDLHNSTFAKCYHAPDNDYEWSGWLKKSEAKPDNALFGCVSNELVKILEYTEQTYQKYAPLYKSAALTVKHLNQLSLLNVIDKKVREMNQDANRFLLSDTQTLLHSLIQDSDSPFIFEKIGTQLEHVMIDEFQDTSTIQWQNFKVLLEETMSHENASNLIVGDVKQSIYRWRSGDWRLLNNIKAQFSNSDERLIVNNLVTNWRSNRNIIDFNNAFFTVAAEQEYTALKEDIPEEALQLKNAYKDVKQEVPEDKEAAGLVRIKLLGKEGDNDDDNDNMQERMMKMTLDTVTELHQAGAEFKQMAILVRSNKTIQDIASYFMNHSDYPLVSDEAFRLDASQAVNTIITSLYHLIHPEDAIAVATIHRYSEKYQVESLLTTFEEKREDLLKMPLYELTEHLYKLLKLGEIEDMKQQSAYVCAFYDNLSCYLADNYSDIEGFLTEWDNSIKGKSIHSDVIDGISLITIHKSKGLEFDHVIMPFCDWTLEKGNTIWCTPEQKPFNELPLVPVDFAAKQMKGSIYQADYYHEHLQNVVDNLNLLYVAFTRAGRNLFVYGKRGGTTLRSNVIESSLAEVVEELQKGQQPLTYQGDTTKANEEGTKTSKKTTKKEASKGDITFEYGSLYIDDAKEKKQTVSANVFDTQAENLQFDILTTEKLPVFRQSKNSREYIQGDDEEEQKKYYIKLGTVLHNLFSTIRTQEDIDGALKQLELDGVLYDKNVSKESIKNMIRKRLASKQVSDWFSDRWTVYNECSILTKIDGKVVRRRPDRVLKNEEGFIVIDFKFGKPKEEYHEQVREYMQLLRGMGNEQVKGYLWFVYTNKVVEVK